ncbi:MAG: hypothetical protein BWY19_00803 [bacterium ADurb.Bin212]|nr:MAG: hypothetical protein BWY19_00803 [bacterium ADurb.Bin212]
MGDWQDKTDNVMRICRDTFSSTILYTPKLLAQRELIGIFDEAYQVVEILDGASVASVKPRLGLRLLDLDFYPQNFDEVTINGTDYRVVEIQPDGEAGIQLFLHKDD